jgi:hypothetical protein
MKHYISTFAFFIAAVAVIQAAPAAQGNATNSPSQLEIFHAGYPRYFQFRIAETSIARDDYGSYEAWAAKFRAYPGIIGKMDGDEARRSKVKPYFLRFKRENPDKLVMVHRNLRSGDPDEDGPEFFAGHWLYWKGCHALSAIPAMEKDTEIEVEDVTLFKSGIGDLKKNNEDVVMCALTSDGRPDWNKAEQVTLLAINRDRKTLTVKRACHGTKPREFAAGRAYLAAHVYEGPFARATNLLWCYNHSMDCPRDLAGRNCDDVLTDLLSRQFGPGGELEPFDGLAFDVVFSQVSREPARGIDTDGDGIPDNGKTGKHGEDRFLVGSYALAKELREKLGPSRLLTGDGSGVRNGRGFDQFNGMESEGWPDAHDIHVEEWSDGLNRVLFWVQNSFRPNFDYLVHKFRGFGRGEEKKVATPRNLTRLFFAAAQFLDAGVAISDFPPSAQKSDRVVDWDELVKGEEHTQGWLGHPVSATVHLARTQPDLLNGLGMKIDAAFAHRFSGEKVEIAADRTRIRVTSNSQPLVFRLNDLHPTGSDLTAFFRIRADPATGVPAGAGRLAKIRLIDQAGRILKEGMTWCNGHDFEAVFYADQVENGPVSLEFELEGQSAVWLDRLTVHAAPDVVYREFEQGLVLANPSRTSVPFGLEKLLPGKSFRRIRGTKNQDPLVNDGSKVGPELTLPAKDALFLVKNSSAFIAK